MQIFFDLDGTLIDSKPRMYKLFQHLVAGSKLSFEDYWNLKRDKVDHETILKKKFLYTTLETDRFKRAWLDAIELPEWLAIDQPFDGVTEFLSALKKKHQLYLITARQSEERTLWQIARLGWNFIFDEIFVTGLNKEKHLAVRGMVLGDSGWLVGDSGNDIQTGKVLGLHTAAVLSGILSREKLMKYNPDVVVDHVLLLDFLT